MISKDSDLLNFMYNGKNISDISAVKVYIKKNDITGAKNYLAGKGIDDDGLCAEIIEDVSALIKDNEEDDIGEFDAAINGLAFGDAVYSVKGCRGRYLEVYEDFVVITVSTTIGSVLTGNVLDGQKVIFYKDCIGIQFKASGSFIGYLQVETASATMNNGKSNFFNENTFTFDKENKLMREIYKYVFDKVHAYKK